MKYLISLLLIIGICNFSYANRITDPQKPEDAERIKIKNKTRFQLAFSIKYLDEDDDWVVRHYILDPGETTYCCYTNNIYAYYYAVDTYGYGWQISGWDNYSMNYYNTYVGFRKKKLSSKNTITLYE